MSAPRISGRIEVTFRFERGPDWYLVHRVGPDQPEPGPVVARIFQDQSRAWVIEEPTSVIMGQGKLLMCCSTLDWAKEWATEHFGDPVVDE